MAESDPQISETLGVFEDAHNESVVRLLCRLRPRIYEQ